MKGLKTNFQPRWLRLLHNLRFIKTANLPRWFPVQPLLMNLGRIRLAAP